MVFENILFNSLVISLVIQVLFFIFAASFKTDKLTDFTYGLTFIILAWQQLITGKNFNLQNLILVLAITTWGIRLITYLFARILKIKKDRRFDKIRGNFKKFASFWFFQGLSVWAIIIPAIVFLSQNQQGNPTGWFLTGLLIWLIGLVIETIADWQKFAFKNNPANKGRWVETGLWQYSRHPNYFGEILCWWGLYLAMTAGFNSSQWWTIIGPAYITFILLFVSGIPPLEKRYQKKYGENKDYLKYKDKTPVLVPFLKI